jgi:hypothetical protein
MTPEYEHFLYSELCLKKESKCTAKFAQNVRHRQKFFYIVRQTFIFISNLAKNVLQNY